MSKPKKITEKERQGKLQQWSNTAAVNPRYKGATLGDVARALLRFKPNPEKK